MLVLFSLYRLSVLQLNLEVVVRLVVFQFYMFMLLVFFHNCRLVERYIIGGVYSTDVEKLGHLGLHHVMSE